MISVEEAQERVLRTTNRLSPISCRLSQSLGMILAEDVISDIDMPPYDKALVDGFAVRSADLPAGRGELECHADVFAGQMPSRSLEPGEAIGIMTGAPIPKGVDAIVMQEKTEISLSQGARPPRMAEKDSPVRQVTVNDPQLRAGQHIMRRGTELTRGQLVLKSGIAIRPSEIGLLAAVGRAEVSVFPRPRVTIVSTGNEIVEAHEKPNPGQIRNSNGPLLAALAERAGGSASYLGIGRDCANDLHRLIEHGLAANMLLLSGGVSAGQLDLVPGVLRALGVRELFHKVNLKPGKPVWFGIREREALAEQRWQPAAGASHNMAAHHETLIFGLPGNPVSVMACFELFVRPAIRRMTGCADPGPRVVSARLAEDRSSHSERPTYWPAWLEPSDDGWHVRLVAWKGSPDLRAMTDANCFAIIPRGDHQFRRGDRINVLSTEY